MPSRVEFRKTTNGKSIFVHKPYASKRPYMIKINGTTTSGVTPRKFENTVRTAVAISKIFKILKVPAPTVSSISITTAIKKLQEEKRYMRSSYDLDKAIRLLKDAKSEGYVNVTKMNILPSDNEYYDIRGRMNIKKKLRFSELGKYYTFEQTYGALKICGKILTAEYFVNLADRGTWNYLVSYTKNKKYTKIKKIWTIDLDEINDENAFYREPTIYDNAINQILSTKTLADDIEFLEGVNLVKNLAVKKIDDILKVSDNLDWQTFTAINKLKNRCKKSYQLFKKTDSLKLAFKLTNVYKSEIDPKYLFWDYMK